MGKDRKMLSMKELMSTKDGVTLETERMPQYIIVQPKFSCPLSPHIMWHHGLQYSGCPITESERDMAECEKCIHHGGSEFKAKSNKRNRPKHKKDKSKTEKRSKESIQKDGKMRGKTYVSE
jgi:hypothetical protein